MPIRVSGVRGGPGFLAVPAGGSAPTRSPGQESMPFGGDAARRTRGNPRAAFKSPALNAIGKFITGVTKDSTGTPVGACTVQLFLTATDQFLEEQVSDGSGNFSFGATAGPYYIVAYKVGVPDISGTTVNTLAGA